LLHFYHFNQNSATITDLYYQQQSWPSHYLKTQQHSMKALTHTAEITSKLRHTIHLSVTVSDRATVTDKNQVHETRGQIAATICTLKHLGANQSFGNKKTDDNR